MQKIVLCFTKYGVAPINHSRNSLMTALKTLEF